MLPTIMPIGALKSGINNYFQGKEPWQIVTITSTSVLLIVWFHNFLTDDEDIMKRLKRKFFSIIKKIPYIRNEIETEMAKINTTFKEDTLKRTRHVKYIKELPETGLNEKDILEKLNANLELGDYNWKQGRVSGSVYYFDPKLIQLITETYSKTSYTNPLHPDVFPGLCKMEAEVIRMCVNLFHGDENCCGSVTSGGTESILMACKAYRDYGKEHKNITHPEIVLPTTAHAAFDKAGQYFKIKLKYIPIDPVTTQVNISAMKRAISSNTILLVGSAPNFPYGTIDEIPAISFLGVKYNIPVHVDSCLGGFLTAFMPQCGYPVPTCDFMLPGVTSISVDTHKYGFAPKGTSVILYRDVGYKHHQYTVTTDWPGGVYGSPSVCGSRAGGLIAVCWATLLNFGFDGYVEATRDIIHTTKYIEKGLRRMEGIYIFGTPATSVIAIGSNVFAIYRLSDALSKAGWNLNVLQFPAGIHICVTHMHTAPGVADKFLDDVRTSLEEVLKNPEAPVEGRMALYGVAQSISDRSLVGDFTRSFIDSMHYIPNESDV